MTFYDRQRELAALEEAAESPGHAFFVVYGRRRVGKTALLTTFCADRPHVYYLASQEAERRQREKFVEQVASTVGDRTPRIDGWDEAFEYLGEVVRRDQLVVVIDEFPYLVENNESIPSSLQSFVDEHLQETDSMVVCCGSSVSTMESAVLGHESPLYGRRTGQIDLQPFSFAQARAVIEDDIADAIRTYAITGGTPMYLLEFDADRSLRENVREHVLDPTAVLYNEPEFLLRTELRRPARYMSILESIARGRTTPNEISGATDIDTGPLSKYLATLRRLRLIERTIPVTASKKQTNRSRYRIADPFLRFWFRFVEPNRSAIEQAPDRVYEGVIEPALPDHVATTFETIAREAVWAAVRTGILPSVADIGRWWYGEDEIDVVAIDPADDRILFGECKWTSDPVGGGLVADLQEKSDAVRWGSPDRTERFALFSKAGFEDGLAERLDENWSLFDLDRLAATIGPA